jgi:hypothetical protein
MTEVLDIAAAQEQDLVELAAFMAAQSGGTVDPDRLHHWYFMNPAGSASVIIGRLTGRVVGMATTNDHWFDGPDGRALVAMPQKVLVDGTMRGRGIFSKLYWASEAACRQRGVHFFLTVTNAASTPIFLGKFGYRRLPSPMAIAMAPALGRLDLGPTPDPWPTTMLADWPVGVWHMVKPGEHYRWRYLTVKDPSHLHLSVHRAGRYRGELFLKRTRKAGLPILLLLDAVPMGSQAWPDLLRAARVMALRLGCLGLLALERPGLGNAVAGIPRKRLSSGLNLLVKGLDDTHTERLQRAEFNLAFGDLDFL